MLKINQKFKELIPPLSPEEFGRLEKNILAQGCRDAITTWRGTIVDGHNRYAICTSHGIPYKTTNINFANRQQATLWIVENQLGRRNLSDDARIRLALQKTGLTRKQIAEYARVTDYAVKKYLRVDKLQKTITTKTVKPLLTRAELKYMDILNYTNKIEGIYRFIMENLPKNADDGLYDEMVKVLKTH